MLPTLVPVADYACHTGEGPLYDPDANVLYWTDIPAGRLFRFDLATGHHEPIYQGLPVGGMTLLDGGGLLLFRAHGNIAIWRDGEIRDVIGEIPDEVTTRFNDVFADPQGRVFCGTMPTAERRGRLYRLDPDGSLSLLLENIGCSNGMGLTLDGQHLYYTDTSDRTIWLFDYDEATGGITNQRPFVTVPDRPGEGWPDGMTVDADGYVWSTRWDGACAVRYAPDGTEVFRLPFPVQKVSCITFGGPDYGTAFFTTAGGQQKEIDGEHAGALFSADLGVKGRPEHRAKLRI